MRNYLTSLLLGICMLPVCSIARSDEVGLRVVDQLLEDYQYVLSDEVLNEARTTEDSVALLYSPPHHYAQACAGFGAVQLCAALDDDERIQQLGAICAGILSKSPPIQTDHVDANVFGIFPFELYRVTGDERWLDEGLRLADSQWEQPNADGLTNQARYWVDDMWMVASLQVQACRTTGKQKYLDRAAHLLAAYLPKLQQSNGLFHHADNVPHYWGRGNGWVADALAFTLKELPPEHPQYEVIHNAYVKMMETLLILQTSNGMWRQLLDNPDSWEESSCTAMFAYAMAAGINGNLLPADRQQTYKKATLLAWSGLMDHLTDEGQLTDICVGTGKFDSVQYYLDRPRQTGDMHGQAPLLWLAYALLEW